ncbi:Phosphatidylinositol 5-phosphate 4-kinase type-2 alpha [Podila humilis]|nr:Phosphatidylinositol 5-phosphate 4-kinase type-2 alpha [Podila humilis]
MASIRTRIQENYQEQDAAVLIDSEARWRDHHLKREWAQSVLLESNEPVLSRHLRHAIKSVLHFTSLSPESMDFKSTSQDIGGWESFVAPTIPPPTKPNGNGFKPGAVTTTMNNSSKTPAWGSTTSLPILTGLPRSSSVVKTTTSQSNVAARMVEVPLATEPTSHQSAAPPFISDSPSQSQGGQQPNKGIHAAHSVSSSPPIIVRGFRTARVSHPPASDSPYPRPMSTAVGRTKELDRIATPTPSPVAEAIYRVDATLETAPTASTPLPPFLPKDNTKGTYGGKYAIATAQLEQLQQLPHESPSRPESKPSRLWSRVRKAVHGGFSSSNVSTTSLYQSAGGTAGNLRSMSDTHLPYRPTTSTSLSSFNAATPPFGSSVLSSVSDDQTPHNSSSPIGSPPRPPPVFQTPPETAPNSPTISSTQKHGRHFLPDLTKKSSVKSPAARAELTAAESNVRHFTSRKEEDRRTQLGDSRPESMVQELGIRLEQGLLPKSHSSLRLSVSSTHTRLSSNRHEETMLPPYEEIPLSDRNSTASLERQHGPSDHVQQDFDQFLMIHQGYIEADNSASLAQERSQPHQQLGVILREGMGPSSTAEANSEKARDSLVSNTEEDQRMSRMLLPPTIDLLNPSKTDRRKSAISFGYFSTSFQAAVRSSQDRLESTIPGLEAGSKGEVLHMRRTSFFERFPTSPRVETTTLSGLPLGSLKEREPTAPPHSLPTGTQTTITTTSASEARQGKLGARLTGEQDTKKKKPPLKISPLVITGIAGHPSPMAAPTSAGIPRHIAIDRHYYSVDRVHEWNIPSYGRVKFTDHAPMVFQAVRERFQYTLQDMDEALSQPMTVMRTPGKSDAIFFVSHNHGRILLKTLRGSEPENLKNFLSEYMAHIHKYPNTLLPRYLGMYTFEKLSGSKTHGLGSTSISGGGQPNHLGHGRDGDKEQSFSFKTGSGPSARHDSRTASQQHHLHLSGTLLSGQDDGLPSKVIVVVLANVFDTADLMDERYDFKGSNVGRRTLSDNPVAHLPLSQEMSAEAGVHLSTQSVGPDLPRVDLFRRRSQRNQRRQEDNFNQAQNTQQEAAGSSTTGQVARGIVSKEDISNLTLKEVDFQNRVNSGQTHLIHVGAAKRSEILSQLEEDTALLRKHQFMDYSLLVGIHIIPKIPTVQSEASESSLWDSRTSRGADADYSSTDSENEDMKSLADEERSRPDASDSLPEVFDQMLAILYSKGFLHKEHATYLKRLKNVTEETILDVVEMVRRISGHPSEERETDNGSETRVQGREVQGKSPAGSSRQQHSSKDLCDWDAFKTPTGTIRHHPKIANSDAKGGLPEVTPRRRSKSKTVGANKVGAKNTFASHRRYSQRLNHRGSTSQDQPVPLKQQRIRDARPKKSLSMLFSIGDNNSGNNNGGSVWSRGVPSVDLPNGYEAVYYFGLIDILQKYGFVKWFERGLKGANARLLGPSTPTTVLQAPPLPSPLPGRSIPTSSISTSFSASTLCHLLPMATTSEPSPSPPVGIAAASEPFPSISSALPVPMEKSVSQPVSSVSMIDPFGHTLAVADKRISASTNSTNISLSGSISGHHYLFSHSSGSSHGSSDGGSGNSRRSSPKSISELASSSRQSITNQHSIQPSHHSGTSISIIAAGARGPGAAGLDSSSLLPAIPLPSSPQAQSGTDDHPQPAHQEQQHQHQQQPKQQQSRHQSQPSYQAFYHAPQHAEVSVEEPGRYAERLVDYVRSVLV